jgi:pilus assembly protein CpaB
VKRIRSVGDVFMKNTGKVLILVSLMLSLVVSVFIFIYLKPLKTSDKTVNERTILVAAETILQRTIIEKKMIKEIQVPDNAIFENYIVDSSNIVGKYTTETILKDEGFHKDKLASEINNELILKIGENNRAISINVNGSTGVSDLIKQGDFVDVIVSLPEKKDGQKIVNPDLSKILLQNIQVLAVDKILYKEELKRVEIPTNYLVTLSVAIADIEKLILAEDIGQLKLVLRPLRVDYIHKSEGATREELILNETKEIKNSLPEENKMNIGDNSNEKYFYYKVQQGDTLRKISTYFYGDPLKYILIKQANGISEENIIITGINIKIPVLVK